LNTQKSLAKILKLRPVNYHMLVDANCIQPCIGLLAQEVQEITPWAVESSVHRKHYEQDESGNIMKDASGNDIVLEAEMKLSLNYQDMTIHLIGAVQEMNKTIQSQADMITSLQSTVAMLVQQVTNLSNQMNGNVQRSTPSGTTPLNWNY
jgi:hypothetical protein